MCWNGVVAPSAQRMASRQAADGQIKAASQAVIGERLACVLRTTWLETAGWAEANREQRRDQQSISGDRSQDRPKRERAKSASHPMQRFDHCVAGPSQVLAVRLEASLPARLLVAASSSAARVALSISPAPVRAITTIAVPRGNIVRSLSLKHSRTRRLTRLRTTAAPMRLETVSPSFERCSSEPGHA